MYLWRIIKSTDNSINFWSLCFTHRTLCSTRSHCIKLPPSLKEILECEPTRCAGLVLNEGIKFLTWYRRHLCPWGIVKSVDSINFWSLCLYRTFCPLQDCGVIIASVLERNTRVLANSVCKEDSDSSAKASNSSFNIAGSFVPGA